MAVVLYRNGIEKMSMQIYLGTKDEHMVFKVELVGVLLAAKLIKEERGVCMATIGADNQAVIQATQSVKRAPGYHLVNRIHEQIAVAWCKHPGLRIELRWTPRHEGIQGNE